MQSQANPAEGAAPSCVLGRLCCNHLDGAVVPSKAEPLAGNHSFLQEETMRWSDINTAADFMAATCAIHPHAQTLPLLA
eukprot:jgi/Astpho2/207/Aster-02118